MSRPDRRHDRTGIDRTAADWVARQVRGLSAPEEDALAEWLRADFRHAQAFTELEETWQSLDRLQGAGMQHGCRLEADLPPATAPVRRRMLQGMLVAAAALAVGYFGWWRPAQMKAPFALMVATEIGDLKQMRLPDGSVLHLNTDSSAEVAYTEGERRIHLVRGEARFEVAKNPSRPFVVQAGGIDVRAVGTVFNVRLRAEAVDVLVTEGKVRVNDAASGIPLLAAGPAKEAALLVAGERASIALAAPAAEPLAIEPVSPTEIERTLAWQDRRLVFDAAPLAEMVAEFNRYSRRQLVIADPRLNDRQFGGTFAVANQEAFVRLLESRFAVKAEHLDHEIRLRLAVPEKSP